MFDISGAVYRRNGSCSCGDCMKRVKPGKKCFGMSGAWNLLSPNMFKQKQQNGINEHSVFKFYYTSKI